MSEKPNHPEGYVNHFDTVAAVRVRVSDNVFNQLPMGSTVARCYGCTCQPDKMDDACRLHTVVTIIEQVGRKVPELKGFDSIIVGLG